MLEQAGWDAIKDNNLPVASATFKEAITLDPEERRAAVGRRHGRVPAAA